jgi:hypothetical protein
VAADGRTSHRGKHYSFDDVRITPKPVQRPIPSYVGTVSKPSIELAARLECGDCRYRHRCSEIVLIHWVGGVHTEIRLPTRRRGQRTSTSAVVIAAVRQLVLRALFCKTVELLSVF